MKILLTGLLAIIISGCSTGNKHADVKVKAIHAWEHGRAKSCMLLTRNSVVQGTRREAYA